MAAIGQSRPWSAASGGHGGRCSLTSRCVSAASTQVPDHCASRGESPWYSDTPEPWPAFGGVYSKASTGSRCVNPGVRPPDAHKVSAPPPQPRPPSGLPTRPQRLRPGTAPEARAWTSPSWREAGKVAVAGQAAAVEPRPASHRPHSASATLQGRATRPTSALAVRPTSVAAVRPASARYAAPRAGSISEHPEAGLAEPVEEAEEVVDEDAELDAETARVTLRLAATCAGEVAVGRPRPLSARSWRPVGGPQPEPWRSQPWQPSGCSAAYEQIGTLAAHLQALRNLAWSPKVWLQAREQVISAGRPEMLTALARAVRESTDKAFRDFAFFVGPGCSLNRKQERRVDLAARVPLVPEFKWFGHRNLRVPCDDLCRSEARKVTISEASPLEIVRELRGLGHTGPIILVAEVSAYTPDGGIDLAAAALFPEDLALRSDLARFTCALQGEATRNSYEASVKHHLTSLVDPYLVRCPKMTLLRGSQEEGYPFLEEPVNFTTILMGNADPRPCVQSVSLRRRQPMEWYDSTSHTNALIERLTLLGELARQEPLLQLQADGGEADEDDMARALSEDEMPILIMGLPGSSEASRFPRDAVANAVKHWRRQYADYFKQVFVCCRGRQCGDKELAQHTNTIVNREPGAEYLAQALGEEHALVMRKLGAVGIDDSRARTVVPEVKSERIGDSAFHRDILDAKLCLLAEASDGAQAMKEPKSVVDASRAAMSDERAQAIELKQIENANDMLCKTFNKSSKARRRLNNLVAKAQVAVRKQAELQQRAKSVELRYKAKEQDSEERSKSLPPSVRPILRRCNTDIPAKTSGNQSSSGEDDDELGMCKAKSVGVSKLSQDGIKVNFDAFFEEKVVEMKRWEARVKILERSRSLGLSRDMQQAALPVPRWCNLEQCLPNDTLNLRIVAETAPKISAKEQQAEAMKDLRNWFFMENRHRIRKEVERRAALKAKGVLCDGEVSEDNSAPAPRYRKSIAVLNSICPNASELIKEFKLDERSPQSESARKNSPRATSPHFPPELTDFDGGDSAGRSGDMGPSSSLRSPSSAGRNGDMGPSSSLKSPRSPMVRKYSMRAPKRASLICPEFTSSTVEETIGSEDMQRRQRSLKVNTALVQFQIISKFSDEDEGPVMTFARTEPVEKISEPADQDGKESLDGDSIGDLSQVVVHSRTEGQSRPAGPRASIIGVAMRPRGSTFGGHQATRNTIIESGAWRAGRLPAFEVETASAEAKATKLEGEIQDIAASVMEKLQANAAFGNACTARPRPSSVGAAAGGRGRSPRFAGPVESAQGPSHWPQPPR